MAERFDRYYEYFSGRSRATRSGRFRRLNLGIVSIDLSGGGSVLRVNIGRSRAHAIEVVGGVVQGEEVNLTNPPDNIKVVKGRRVRIENSNLESVEGEEVTLVNADVERVVGRVVKVVRGDVGHVEGEDVTLINTNAREVVASRGRFVNCDIGVLRYRDYYDAVNTHIGEVIRLQG
ncbi:MAG: hypothetical protein L7H00_05240 [Vulcanisaeta sp.]|nr:hypothetical protein [Vulcanisaeta sp.]MCG2892922.1 hypothetical protein [Vulcanisaeta sp.]MCG2895583.1 hypothetical protein [Vulcanisaeta sp.]